MPTIAVKDGRVTITNAAGSTTFETVDEAIAWCRRIRDKADLLTLGADKIEEQIREQAGARSSQRP